MVTQGRKVGTGPWADQKLYVNVNNVKAVAGFDKAALQVINPDNSVYSITAMDYDSGSSSPVCCMDFREPEKGLLDAFIKC
ncbi:Ig-like domain repeat protein [Klebsiella pneumoniae]